jgi:hypothetical protein
MLRYAFSLIPVLRNFTIASVHLVVLSLILLPLAGCSENGSDGPNISSLSTPTNTHSNQGTEANPNPTETATSEQDDPTISEASAESEPLPSEVAEADLEPPPPTGATARLNWDASSDPNVQGYFIHYGKQSSGEPGSCSYEESQRVGAPPATITGLEPNTPYFFAISAFSEAESESETPCSNEVLLISSPAQG